MKKIIVTAFLAMSLSTFAQVNVPQASPKVEIEQVVGLTEIELEYARPGMKDRVVFGEMVPYGKVWRTGANENTTIQFSDDVSINGKPLPKGKYALYTVPNKDNWDVIFYQDTENWGVPQNWDDKKVVLKVKADISTVEKPIEYLNITVNPLNNNRGELVIGWEKTQAIVYFEVPTQKKALQSIEEGLNANASARDYYSAAQYLYSEGIDVDKALSYMEHSIKMSGGDEEAPFYVLRQKALIQAAIGDKQGAIVSAKRSSESAKKAGNEEYIKMNEKSIEEWSK